VGGQLIKKKKIGKKSSGLRSLESAAPSGQEKDWGRAARGIKGQGEKKEGTCIFPSVCQRSVRKRGRADENDLGENMESQKF